jgi:alanine dehydrogenase
VDVAIDQGGSIATIDRVTTHDHPCYEKHGVIHYSVANIPGAVPRTATWALTNTTLPYLVKLADKGLDALREDKALLAGLNLHDGKLTCEAVATAFDLPWTPARPVLSLPNCPPHAKTGFTLSAIQRHPQSPPPGRR